MKTKNNFVSRLDIADTFSKTSRCVTRKKTFSGCIVRDSFAHESELFDVVFVELNSTFQGLLQVRSTELKLPESSKR